MESEVSIEAGSASLDTRNWINCFLCQSTTSESLVNPSLNTRLKQHPEELDVTLRGVINNIETLKHFGDFPSDIDVDDIFAGVTDVNDIVNLLKSNNVVWHKGCKSKVDNQKVKRAQVKRAKAHDIVSTSPVKTCRLSNECSGQVQAEASQLCLLCEKAGGKSLRRAATFGLDDKVRRCATIIGDKTLIRKLSSGDMVAIDAVYHLKCLAKLYRQAASIESTEDEENYQISFLKAQTFADLISHMESQRGTLVVFKMADIATLYSDRLVSLGVDGYYVHTTRLRNQVTAAMPDLIEVKTPSERIDLAFDEDVSPALQQISESCESDVMLLVKAAKILRRHVLNMKYGFTGSFSHESETIAVPPILLSFQKMLLKGPGILKGEFQVSDVGHVPAAALSISQLVV